MVAPITGQFASSQTFPGPYHQNGWRPDWISIQRRWYRQKRPYNLPLPFTLERREMKWCAYSHIYGYGIEQVPLPGVCFTTYAGNTNGDIQRVYNEAYESFANGAKGVRAQKADLLTMARERQKSLTMIAVRSSQLLKFVKSASRGRLGDMRDALRDAWGERRSPLPEVGVKRHIRRSGGHVLEYSFGWAPLVSDIHSAISIFRNGSVRPRAMGSKKLTSKINYLYGDSSPIQHYSGKVVCSWVLRADVRIVDPGLALLNDLGLINLASSAWETTPWSFVVDYFVNVQSWLNGFTDRLGLEWDNATSTLFLHAIGTNTMTKRPEEHDPPWGGYGSYGFDTLSVSRQMGISRPTLAWRMPWRLSPARALTSVALLLQQLRK